MKLPALTRRGTVSSLSVGTSSPKEVLFSRSAGGMLIGKEGMRAPCCCFLLRLVSGPAASLADDEAGPGLKEPAAL